MKDTKKEARLLRAVGNVGQDLLSEAEDFSVKKSSKKKILIPLVAALLALSMIAGAAVFIGAYMKRNPNSYPPAVFHAADYISDAVSDLPDALKSMSVTANGSDSRMISPSSVFTVVTAGACTAATLAKYLSFSPKVEYSVKQKDEKTFEVAPASGSLVPGAVYRLMLGDPQKPVSSYAFQTESELIVKSVLPGDKSIGAPVDTGIEIVFSEAVRSVDFSKYVSVSPRVRGSFMLYQDGRTLAFIPSSPLNYNKVYTVTVKEGITSLSGKALKQEKTFAFRTVTKELADAEKADGSFIFLTLNQNLNTVCSPGEPAMIDYHFNYHRIEDAGKMKVVLYRFGNADDAYKTFLKRLSDPDSTFGKNGGFDLTKMTRVFENTYDQPKRYDSISFGTELEEGVYLAQVTVSAQTLNHGKTETTGYTIIQITPLRSTLVSAQGENCILAGLKGSDTVKGALVSGCSFVNPYGWSLDAKADFTHFAGETDQNGAFFYKNGEAQNSSVYTVKKDGHTLICAYMTDVNDEEQRFMSYLYTDRNVYFSDDTVNFHGFVYMLNGNPLPENLYLQTGFSPVKEKLALNSDGSFTGSYRIESMRSCSICLKIVDEEGAVYADRWINVTKTDKPVITASITFDKPCYRRGDVVKATLSAKFFDGTPAEGFEFIIRCDPFKEAENYVTDENGEITVTFRTHACSAHSIDPLLESVCAELTGMETQSLYVSAVYPYYHSDYVFKTERKDDGVHISVYDLDLTGYPENVLGAPAQKNVSVDLISYTTVKTERTRYDTYLKRNVRYYDYSVEKTVVSSETFTTVNGEAVLPYVDEKSENVRLTYEIRFNDGVQTFKYLQYAGYTERYVQTGPNTELEVNADRFAVEDIIRARMIVRGAYAEKAMYFICSDGMKETTFAGAFETVYKKDYIPGAMLYSVCFWSDSGVFVTDRKYLFYDYQSVANVKLEITPDRAEYKPGDTATVAVKASDVTGGWVIVSVVDEACFALGDQNENAAAEFFDHVGRYLPEFHATNFSRNDYAVIGSPLAFSFDAEYYGDARAILISKDAFDVAEEPSMAEPETGNSASGSEKAGYYIRKYFADNPEFKVLQLNENGEGTLVFTVPDNITSWRITGIAVTGTDGDIDGVRVGTTLSNAVCTQSFFISPSICKTYIKGDDAAFSLRCYGRDALGKVSYKAELYNDDGALLAVKESEEEPLKQCFFNFGKLEVGNYKLRLYADCSSYNDALESELNVVASNALLNVCREVTPQELSGLRPALFPLTLVFFDNTLSANVYTDAIRTLAYVNADRCDALVGKYAAYKAREALYGTDESVALRNLAEQIQSFEHGRFFKLFEYGERDIALTATVAALYEELIPVSMRSMLVSEMNTLVSQKKHTDETDLCAALLALSALGEPALDTLFSVAAQSQDFPLEAKLYLAAAFAAIGDFSAAYELEKKIVSEYGVYNESAGTLHLKGSSYSEETKLTSLLLLSASKVCRKDAEACARFVLGNRTESERGTLGLAAYILSYMPTEKTKGKQVTVKIGSETKTLDVNVFTSARLSLTKSQFEAFEILSIDEGVGIRASYMGGLDDAEKGAAPTGRLTISKNYSERSKGVYLVTLKISGRSTLVSECFNLYDTIPAGARFLGIYSVDNQINQTGNVRTHASIYNASGQNMAGYVWVHNKIFDNATRVYKSECPEYAFSVTVSYLVRGAVEGEFISESAYIEDMRADRAISNRATVNVRANDSWTFDYDAEKKEG